MEIIRFILLSSILFTIVFAGVENNYASQMEEGVLMKYWKMDMDYIMNYFKNTVLAPYEKELSRFIKCQLHEIRFTKADLKTDNVKLVIDPNQLHINFTQTRGWDFEIDLIWEWNLLYFPITGYANFKGYTTNVVYTLNLTQPYEGKLLIPTIDCKWVFTSVTVPTTLGSIFSIPKLVENMFREYLEGQIEDELDDAMRADIPLRYEEYYAPKQDTITFPAFPDFSIDIMRRYKRIYIDTHLLAFVYQEIVEPATNAKNTDKIEITRNPVSVGTYLGSGMLRRYVRDFAVFEQASKKLLSHIHEYKITDGDLPKEQKMRLTPSAMENLVPTFKAKFGENANVSVKVSGIQEFGNPLMIPLEPQLIGLSNVGFRFDFYVKQNKDSAEIQFLNTTLLATIELKPVNYWKNDTLVINFEVKNANVEKVFPKSDIFHDIMKESIKRWAEVAIAEFLSAKCGQSAFGNGLKLRDELGKMNNVTIALDVAGRTINSWIYLTKDI